MTQSIATLKRLWRRAPWLTLAMLVAFVLALVFALRFGVALLHSVTLPTDPELAGWMTPRFVALAWDVPPEVILQAVPLDPDGSGRRVTLQDVAQMRSIPLPALLEHLQAAIDTYRAGLEP
jgi:hypothetical protein